MKISRPFCQTDGFFHVHIKLLSEDRIFPFPKSWYDADMKILQEEW